MSIITKDITPFSDRDRVELYLARLTTQIGGWCTTCAGLSELYSPYGDPQGFLVARYEAIRAGTCTCDHTITSEMRECVADAERELDPIISNPF